MANQTDELVIAFNGSKKVKDTAAAMFAVLRAQGAFMSDNAVIRVSIPDLAAYIDETEKTIGDVIAKNPEVFATETDENGTGFVLTTRVGRAPIVVAVPDTHNLKQRLMTPEPKPAPRPRPVREVVRANEAWATFQSEEDEEPEEEFEFAEAVAAEEAPSVPVAEEPAAVDTTEATEVAAAEATPDAEIEAEAETTFAEELEAVAEVVVEPAEPVVEAVVEPETEIEEARPEIPVFVEEVVAAPTPARPLGEPTDFSDISAEVIEEVLERQFAHDAHVAFFGGRWMTTDRAHRLSRGNVRDIRQYIEEQEQPLTDEVIVEDVLRVRPGSPEYANTVFGLNYWLSRERDFEFVGSRDQKFWGVTDLPQLGTTLRKPNDIGSDYRFLTDSIDAEAVEHRSVSSVDHTISFYEWNLGLLPYDAEMQQLFPEPMMPDQRSAVFTFEIPQLYATYLVELRYPTPTRGGFFLGLDDLYFDSLVPGAIISITATENDGHYKVEYIEGEEQTDRLLEIDEKRPRYHFQDTTYSCGVEDSWLISENRFPRLGGMKPMSDRDRRKITTVVEMTFERVGMEDGNGSYLASFEDVLAAINIERPVNEEMLRREIELHDKITGDDANGYTYVAG